MTSVKELAKKWYYRLPFPKEYEEEFLEIIKKEKELEHLKIDAYETIKDGLNNQTILLYCLYFFEELSEWYEQEGLSVDMMIKGVKDLTICVYRCVDGTKKVGLEPDMMAWMLRLLRKKLFRFERYQFEMSEAMEDVEKLGIKKGEPVVNIHIPAEGRLDTDRLLFEMKEAIAFLKKHFPTFEFTYFSCYSWVLDETLKEFLSEQANILAFQRLFEIVKHDKSEDVFKFMFRFRMQSREELKNFHPETGFAKKIKTAGLEGREFYEGWGLFSKKELL